MDGQPLALVTGAAHRLGKLFALTLAQRGYSILLHYHNNENEAANTADEIRALGVEVYLVKADLTKEANIVTLLSEIDNLPHQLKILVNSASLMQRKEICTITANDWDFTLDLNLRAPFLLAQQSIKRMLDGGLIINITDAGAPKLWTGYPAYVISKTALETLTRLLAKAYAPGIRVNAIAPGLVLPSDSISKGEWEKLVERLPAKHPVPSDDVAAALIFLLDNPSITGQILIIDGGYSFTR